LNATKFCIWNAADTGCWDATAQGVVNGGGGFVLLGGANASLLMRYTNGTDVYSEILIDINGSQGPNEEGQEQIYGYICYNSNGCPLTNTIPGRFTAKYAPSEDYYKEIFTN
jgi:hypothetical protein